MKQLYEVLIAEPYCWTPKEIGEMTLDELDLSFTKAEEPIAMSLDAMVEYVRKNITK